MSRRMYMEYILHYCSQSFLGVMFRVQIKTLRGIKRPWLRIDRKGCRLVWCQEQSRDFSKSLTDFCHSISGSTNVCMKDSFLGYGGFPLFNTDQSLWPIRKLFIAFQTALRSTATSMASHDSSLDGKSAFNSAGNALSRLVMGQHAGGYRLAVKVSK